MAVQKMEKVRKKSLSDLTIKEVADLNGEEIEGLSLYLEIQKVNQLARLVEVLGRIEDKLANLEENLS